jgi:hypothetical protein
MFRFLRSLHTVFQDWLQQLSFPPAVYDGSFLPTSSPTLVIGGVSNDGYSNRDEVGSYCGFDLHFLYG